MRQAHAVQNVRGLGELDVVIADDLDAIAPWIQEIKKASGQRLNSRCGEGLAYRLLVIDDQPEMTAIVRSLSAALLQGKELIAEIDES